ncbi:hypothetical protein ABIA20_001530 [Sinorhizobium fredii]
MPTETVKVGPALSGEHAEAPSIAALRKQAEGCQRCDLYKNATQLVFGEGPAKARVVLVGEQPGDREDLAGRPFVGPAGRILDECLHRRASIDRAAISPMPSSTSSSSSAASAGCIRGPMRARSSAVPGGSAQNSRRFTRRSSSRSAQRRFHRCSGVEPGS